MTNLIFLIFIKGQPCAFTEDVLQSSSARVAPIKESPMEQEKV